MREFISLLASMMQAAMLLLFLKLPSLIPVVLPDTIAYATANPRSVDRILLFA